MRSRRHPVVPRPAEHHRTALADVLCQVVVPEIAKPAQRGVLEAVRAFPASKLDADVADRATAAVDTPINSWRIRLSTQHADARHRAVSAFQEIGLPFPPPSWEYAWNHIAVQARTALDVIREEIHANHPAAQPSYPVRAYRPR